MALSQTAEDTSPLDERAPDPTDDDGVPRRLGRFELLGRLGEGGMGVVYRARDPRLGRDVALKLLGTQHGHSPERTARLIAEARAMARISHPNVLGVFEVEAEGKRPFIVLELVTGGTLREWLKSASPPLGEVLTAFSRAGAGLLAAHDAELVHRDFKPENVLRDTDGRIRVADLGLASSSGQVERFETSAGEPLARDSEPPALGRTRLTRSGSVLGTPAYMAPEQHRGDAVDARTDQFAFCVALHEALTGTRPFPGDSPAAVRERVLKGEPEALPRSFSPALRGAVRRGLSRDPADRYPSLAPLLEVLEGAPLESRRGPWMGLLAVGAGLLAVLLVWALVSNPESRAEGAKAAASASAQPTKREAPARATGLAEVPATAASGAPEPPGDGGSVLAVGSGSRRAGSEGEGQPGQALPTTPSTVPDAGPTRRLDLGAPAAPDTEKTRRRRLDLGE